MGWQGFWRQRTALHWALLPLSLLFGAAGAVRRWCYRAGLFSSSSVGVPVVIVGNIVVGGGGKTPLVIALVEALKERGFNPGVAARGVGGKNSKSNSNNAGDQTAPLLVEEKTPYQECGDEPLLIYRRTGAPVCVCPDRVRAALALKEVGCDIIVCDDGLQHYALQRDIEICAVNASFGLGNGFLLPAGPLREGAWRLGKCDYVAVCGVENVTRAPELTTLLSKVEGREGNTRAFRVFDCPLECDGFYRLGEIEGEVGIERSGKDLKTAADFNGKQISAIAGIAEPERFFTMLENANIPLRNRLPLPDHAKMTDAMLKSVTADVLLMTEKDAVKYTFRDHENIYAARMSCTIPPELLDKIVSQLKSK